MGRPAQGVEDESSDALGVSGQVAHLIRRATDKGTLSQMYPGWMPWV